jgi:hypothetical protein
MLIAQIGSNKKKRMLKIKLQKLPIGMLFLS